MNNKYIVLVLYLCLFLFVGCVTTKGETVPLLKEQNNQKNYNNMDSGKSNIWYDLPKIFSLKIGMTEKEILNLYKGANIARIYPTGRKEYIVESTSSSIFYVFIDPEKGLVSFSFTRIDLTKEEAIKELIPIFGIPKLDRNEYNYFNSNLPENIKIIVLIPLSIGINVMYIYENDF